VRELRHRKIQNCNCADDDHQDRDHHRHDRAIDKEFRHAYLSSADAFSTNGFGFTCAPGRTFIAPSAITRSPAFKPLSTTHIDPTRSPTFTFAIETLFAPSTTAT